MLAIQLLEPGRFQRAELPEPDPPATGEAVVRIHAVGVCGTDLHAFRGDQPFFTYPRILGHELGIEVVSVGEGVTNVAPGEQCAVEPYLDCGRCVACRRGRGNCCVDLKVLGVHVDGGMRPLIALPARKLHSSRTLSFEQLALVETLAIGAHAVGRADPEPGEKVLIVGAGPIGLAVASFAALRDVWPIVLDINPDRLAFCRRMFPACETVVAGGAALALIEELTDGELPTIVFDCTGSPRSMAESFQFTAHSGKLILVGVSTADIAFSNPLLHRRELTVYGTRNALPADMRQVLRAVESGQIDTRPWITHRTPLADVVEVFASFTRPETGVIKAMIEVDAGTPH